MNVRESKTILKQKERIIQWKAYVWSFNNWLILLYLHGIKHNMQSATFYELTFDWKGQRNLRNQMREQIEVKAFKCIPLRPKRVNACLDERDKDNWYGLSSAKGLLVYMFS